MYLYANPGSRAVVGAVIVQDIQQINARTYTCKSSAVHNHTNRIFFGAGEIQVLSDTRLLLRTFPILKQISRQTIDSTFTKITLDDEEWFQALLRSSSVIPRLSAQANTPRPRPTSPRPPAPSPTVGARVERRVALVIGNAAYTDAPLRNPINDATDLATILRRVGFEVALIRDADKPTMERAIEEFTKGVPRGSTGLFFFSGDGAQIDGLNYLIPIGARLNESIDVKYRPVAADWVLGRMDESGMEVKLLILDACRNNPFGRSWTRAVDRGLAVMDAPKGALIAYATSPKKTAADGTGRNSPYTARLLREIPIPGRPIELVFKAVRLGVQQETRGEQTPWEASSLTGEFYFIR